MELIIVAGFLGSGKTTLLLEMARALSQDGQRRVAILENEVGSVGVDGDLLAGEGFKVREILSGCVCCQLRSSLILTLRELEEAFNPDVVLFEPSGVASPDQVVEVCRCFEPPRLFLVVDPVRFQSIKLFSIPLVERGILAAEQVIINKMDAVDAERLEMVRASVATMNPSAQVRMMSARNRTNLDGFLHDFVAECDRRAQERAAAGTSRGPREEEVVLPPGETPTGPRAVVYADEFELSFAPEATSSRLIEEVSNALGRYCDGLQAAGCGLIGHVKAIVKSSDGAANRSVSGYALLSVTSFDDKPSLRGALPGSIAAARVTLNAITYGVEKSVLANLAQAMRAQLQDSCL